MHADLLGAHLGATEAIVSQVNPDTKPGHANPNSDFISVAFEFGKYVETLQNKSASRHLHILDFKLV